MKLVAGVITSDDELDRYLPVVIEHLLAFVDEVVVYDDSADGGGVAFADPRVWVTPRPLDMPRMFEHEANARQLLHAAVMARDPDWVLAIDSDEFICDGPLLRSILEGFEEQGRVPVARLCMQEVWKANETTLSFREDGGWGPHDAPILWRANEGSAGWIIPNRAMASGRVPQQVIGQSRQAVSTGLCILHFGWANEADRAARHDRYVQADGGRFHASAHLDSIMWGDERVRFCHDVWPAALEPYKDRIVERASRC